MAIITIGNTTVSMQRRGGPINPNPVITAVNKVDEFTNEVTWINSPNTTGEFDYMMLMKSEDGINFAQTGVIFFAQPFDISAVDPTDAAPGMTYYYRIDASHYDEFFNETKYISDVWTVGPRVGSYAAPTNLVTTAVSTTRSNVSWTNGVGVPPGTSVEILRVRQDFFPDPSYSVIFQYDILGGITTANSTGYEFALGGNEGFGNWIYLRYKNYATGLSSPYSLIALAPAVNTIPIPINIVSTVNPDKSINVSWTNTYTSPAATQVNIFTSGDLRQGFNSTSSAIMPASTKTFTISHTPGQQDVWFIFQYAKSTTPRAYSAPTAIQTVTINP